MARYVDIQQTILRPTTEDDDRALALRTKDEAVALARELGISLAGAGTSRVVEEEIETGRHEVERVVDGETVVEIVVETRTQTSTVEEATLADLVDRIADELAGKPSWPYPPETNAVTHCALMESDDAGDRCLAMIQVPHTRTATTDELRALITAAAVAELANHVDTRPLVGTRIRLE